MFDEYISSCIWFQDFPETMESHRENKNYTKWNLENTSLILHSYFPDMHIIVVRPSR